MSLGIFLLGVALVCILLIAAILHVRRLERALKDISEIDHSYRAARIAREALK